MSIDKSLKIKPTNYDILQIGSNVFKINEYNLTTMFVIVGTTHAGVIDCGTGVDDFLAIIKQITDLPIILLATHAHVDHIGGREQFDTMYLNEKDIPIIKDVTVGYRRNYIAVMKYLMMFKVISWKKATIKKVVNEPQLQLLKEGDIINLGGRTLTVFETPGHTLGSLSYYLDDDKLLFTGDIVNANNLMFLKHSTSIQELHSTLIKISNIPNVASYWASHLSQEYTTETLDNAIKCCEKIMKKKKNCLLPMIKFTSYNKYVIIHLTNKRFTKKCKS